MTIKELIETLQKIAAVSPDSQVLAGFLDDKTGDYDYYDAIKLDTGFVDSFPKDNAPLIILLKPDPSMSGWESDKMDLTQP